MQILLALLLAHLAGDFLLQRRRVIEGKRLGRWQAYLEHGLVHLLCLAVAWLLFAVEAVPWSWVASAFALVVASHLVIDWLKCRLAGGREALVFIMDQTAHFGVLVIAAWWLSGRPDWLMDLQAFWQASAGSIGWLLVSYLLVVVVCGWLNRMLLHSMLPEDSDEVAGLEKAGLYIGWLERFLMFSAFLVQAWAALGLVLAAKSVFRFESLRRQREHAEYFVIGTLLSVSQVVAVGMVYHWLTTTTTGG
jgi:hypothetical protein